MTHLKKIYIFLTISCFLKKLLDVFLCSFPVKCEAPYTYWLGFPQWLSSKACACQCRRCRFNLWIGKMPWRRKQQPTPVFFSGTFHGLRSLVCCSPSGRKGVRHRREGWIPSHLLPGVLSQSPGQSRGQNQMVGLRS